MTGFSGFYDVLDFFACTLEAPCVISSKFREIVSAYGVQLTTISFFYKFDDAFNLDRSVNKQESRTDLGFVFAERKIDFRISLVVASCLLR